MRYGVCSELKVDRLTISLTFCVIWVSLEELSHLKSSQIFLFLYLELIISLEHNNNEKDTKGSKMTQHSSAAQSSHDDIEGMYSPFWEIKPRVN